MYKVSIEDVIPGMILDQDIYGEAHNKKNPLLCEGMEITASFLYMLKKRGVAFLHTSKPLKLEKDKSPYDMITKANPLAGLKLSMPKSKSIVSPKTKKQALKAVKDFQISISGLDADDVYEVMHILDNVLNHVLADFPKNLTEPINVHQLRGDDSFSYVYRHAISVAVISMAIGQYLSLPPADVRYLGKCASLHDIGMFLIPSKLTQLTPKSAPLKRDELEKIRRHTQLGYRQLVKMGITDEPILNCILHHHERLDGTGYPLGLRGEEISLWSRIIAIADVYDAMTSNRPYRPALPPSEACEFIMANANALFEYDIVAALLRRIEFYPVGICVKLSTGEHAVVIDNTKSRLRPVIRIISTDIERDLNDRRYFDITILKAISYQDIIEKR
ncbi:MAG: HD-GYP domain-containing protein [Defluviitaleaceae bacterium]|nr:HD-GYP domain-containing protein [Defluviitaleaceae bacterium]